MSRIGLFETTSKESMVRDWVRRKLGSVDHEVRVTQVARNLFGLTQRWHKLSPADGRLLTLAALVHDVGRAREDDGHAKHGAQMILDSTALRLTLSERRQLAFLTRYHRGRVPEAGEESYLRDDVGRDQIATLRVLLAILRAADSLDSRSRGGPQLVMTLRGRTLNIYGYVQGSAASAETRYARAKKLELLEATLDCEVRTQWFSTDRVALVA